MKKKYFKCWVRAAIYEVFYLKKVNFLSNLMAGSNGAPKKCDFLLHDVGCIIDFLTVEVYF